jgi:hypothetical protein
VSVPLSNPYINRLSRLLFHSLYTPIFLYNLYTKTGVDDAVSWDFERRRCVPHSNADINRLSLAAPSLMLKVMSAGIPPHQLWGPLIRNVVWMAKQRKGQLEEVRIHADGKEKHIYLQIHDLHSSFYTSDSYMLAFLSTN